MQDAPNPKLPNQPQGLLARWREAWLVNHAPDPGYEGWGMECALPWLQSSQASADRQP